MQDYNEFFVGTEALMPDSYLADCDLSKGKFMSCAVMFRGDVIPKYANVPIATIKTKRIIKFVDWSPAGFKCGINYEPPKVKPCGILA